MRARAKYAHTSLPWYTISNVVTFGGVNSSTYAGTRCACWCVSIDNYSQGSTSKDDHCVWGRMRLLVHYCCG